MSEDSIEFNQEAVVSLWHASEGNGPVWADHMKRLEKCAD
jgi:hypothetical protein